ncbi:hypothetical protein V5O48_010555 [Marasmius crinis-equi]|uniref:Uncharacterized protein n=1 Tax=Marasmius crinis-equi TaxID=585013 RepID=A0ABR3F809_9AGAR
MTQVPQDTAAIQPRNFTTNCFGDNIVDGINVSELEWELTICYMMADSGAWQKLFELESNTQKKRANLEQQLKTESNKQTRNNLRQILETLVEEDAEARKAIEVERGNWLEQALSLRQKIIGLGETPSPRPETVEEGAQHRIAQEGWPPERMIMGRF